MKIDAELTKRIEGLMFDLVQIYTPTGTAREKDAEEFYSGWFASMDYFRNNDGLSGLYAIPGDHIGRSIPWCLLKGSGDATVVLLHHYDVVDTNDYEVFRDLATSPNELAEAFRGGRFGSDPETERDLESGEWIFGRGAADMKGGAAIQMALLERYAAMAGAGVGALRGNILLIALPDEENISAGGRFAPLLLKRLKEAHGLRYALALNAEPNYRIPTTNSLTLSVGSIGKIMPLIYAKGKLSHAGLVYEGFNPIKIMGKIVEKLDLVPELIDGVDGITSPAPTFLYMKDTKNIYDVSLPMAASGYMNLMFFKKSVGEMMEFVRKQCELAFEETIADVQRSFDAYVRADGGEPYALPWKPNVKFYSEAYEEAVRDSGAEFERTLAELTLEIGKKVNAGEMTMVEASHAVVEHTLFNITDASPTVVVALTPPYYPVVGNAMLGAEASPVEKVIDATIARGASEFGENYERFHIIGMSDLSYFMKNPSPGDNAYVRKNMLLWGDIYEIPFDEIDDISMPVLNIGPWGKDIHKYTERVLRGDLVSRTPDLMSFAIETLLGR